MTWTGSQPRGVAQVAESIRVDIVSGRLRSAGELVIADLSFRFDVPMSDIRQALLRLSYQRLVAESSDGTFHVVSTSRQDLRELTAMRRLLEGEAVRLATLRSATASSERLRDAHAALERAAAGVANPGLTSAWRDAHTAFHDALCADCGNERLLATVRSLRDEAEIYRELSAAAMTSDRRALVEAEHRALLEFTLAGRAEDAAAALRDHLEGTMRTVVDEVLGGLDGDRPA